MPEVEATDEVTQTRVLLRVHKRKRLGGIGPLKP
jgi:hypothetical protein